MNESEVERLLRSTVLEPAPGRTPAPAQPWKIPVVAAGVFLAVAVLFALHRPPVHPLAVAGKTKPAPPNAPKPPVRVLYVEGVPRFEYRYLKNALLRDPSVLVQVLLTTADETFPREHTTSDDPSFREPIKAFPADLKSLLDFHVIILGEVDPKSLGPGALDRIVQFVEKSSGGLILISGIKHNPQSYLATPLARLLPFAATVESPPENDPHGWTYLRFADGQAHPITKTLDLEGGGGTGLPKVRWFQRVKQLKPDATAVLEYSKEKTAYPLMVVYPVGQGRVFWSATDETWLWRYLSGDLPTWYPFWQRAIGWARNEP